MFLEDYAKFKKMENRMGKAAGFVGDSVCFSFLDKLLEVRNIKD